jgi:hypothetical protein
VHHGHHARDRPPQTGLADGVGSRLSADRDLLERLTGHYDQIAATDPTAYLHTDGRTPDQLADHIVNLIPAAADLDAVADAT